jgi:[ribosomal protein S18]-alanine N-acetyltransferase
MPTIREGHADDLPFLRHMLMQAYHWNHVGPLPPADEFLSQPNILERLDDWRPADGDRAVIVELDGTPIGAAWYRFGTEEHHAYGYINPQTPELGIGLLKDHRSKGIGRQLINAIIATARREQVASLSLCVDPANYALKLYESVGFVRVGESGTSCTYALKL